MNESVARAASSVTYTLGVWMPSSDNATIGYGLRNVNAARIPASSWKCASWAEYMRFCRVASKAYWFGNAPVVTSFCICSRPARMSMAGC